MGSRRPPFSRGLHAKVNRRDADLLERYSPGSSLQDVCDFAATEPRRNVELGWGRVWSILENMYVEVVSPEQHVVTAEGPVHDLSEAEGLVQHAAALLAPAHPTLLHGAREGFQMPQKGGGGGRHQRVVGGPGSLEAADAVASENGLGVAASSMAIPPVREEEWSSFWHLSRL